MPICKKIVDTKTKAMSHKKCTFTLNNYEKVFLFIILIGLFASIVSCSPSYKTACYGNKKMSIYNSGGYR